MPSTASFWTIINAVYDSSSAALRMNLSYDHTHSSGSGSGGQLDWDVIWSDAVHSHGTDTEGGQLDWDVVWTDAVHNHSAAAEGGVLDHGQSMSSASLADDDHPQYVQENILTTLGDIPYATGSSTWSRVGIGSANSHLVVNSVGTGYTFATGVARVSSGSYTGNGTGNRAITHSLGLIPQVVFIHDPTSAIHFSEYGTAAAIWSMALTSGSYLSVTASDGTSFYVGNAASYPLTANNSGNNYLWAAFG